MSASPEDGASRGAMPTVQPAGAILPSADSVVGTFALRAPAPPAPGAPAPTAPAEAGPVPRGQYRVLRTTQVDEYDAPVALAAVPIPSAPVSDTFGGTARKAAKTSIADAEVEEFDDLGDLIDTLPKHAHMRDREPRISTTADSDRVDEEQRNVRVRAWIYAASREDDNDFHLILGRDPARSPKYMTMEISGLPSSGSPHHARLRRARNDYKSFFQQSDAGLPGTSYDFYDPPVPVEIEGSLFFDVSHANGSRPGPKDLRPHMPVVWEVHPVTAIVFEP